MSSTSARVGTSYDGKPCLIWGDHFKGGKDVLKFVHEHWPEAIHEGVGYWRIPRVAHIHYGVGNISYVPMYNKPLPCFAARPMA